ncbi:MAG: hypothetical protein KC418_18600 [Anaerolineales bacterium]|nr:hypothetical protein [Anaerolineales bacterium]MCB8951011.1 hypothetical protein [Ardenticatenales bacterium]
MSVRQRSLFIQAKYLRGSFHLIIPQILGDPWRQSSNRNFPQTFVAGSFAPNPPVGVSTAQMSSGPFHFDKYFRYKVIRLADDGFDERVSPRRQNVSNQAQRHGKSLCGGCLSVGRNAGILPCLKSCCGDW